jgi:hypothetical protein
MLASMGERAPKAGEEAGREFKSLRGILSPEERESLLDACERITEWCAASSAVNDLPLLVGRGQG